MKKFLLIFASIFFLDIHGVVFTEDSSDELCMELGDCYKSVGYFSGEDGMPYGSGVLVDAKNPHINGRIIITAAHVLYDTEEIYFNINGQKFSGESFIPKEYLRHQLEELPGLCGDYDIGLFFLSQTATQVPLAKMNLKGSLEDLLAKKWLALCGYGRHGPLTSPSRNLDENRRACYSYLSKELNPLEEERKTLNLSARSFLQPSGLSQRGDSGGGIFVAEGNDLVAIIIQGAMSTSSSGISDQYGTGILLSAHQKWINQTLERIGETNFNTSLVLPLFPLLSHQKAVTVTQHVQQKSYETQSPTFEQELSLQNGWAISHRSICNALQALGKARIVKDSGNPDSIRYNAALGLLGSSQNVVREEGEKCLWYLCADSNLESHFRILALNKMQEGEKKEEMKRQLIDDQSLFAPHRLDLIHERLKTVSQFSEIYELAQKALNLGVHDGRYKSDPLLSEVLMLALHPRLNVGKTTLYGLFHQLRQVGDSYLGSELQFQEDFSWAKVFEICETLKKKQHLLMHFK